MTPDRATDLTFLLDRITEDELVAFLNGTESWQALTVAGRPMGAAEQSLLEGSTLNELVAVLDGLAAGHDLLAAMAEVEDDHPEDR